jgi:uncharacterized repeat protein (TIGR01451 family)
MTKLLGRIGVGALATLTCAVTCTGTALASNGEYAEWTLSGKSGTIAVPSTGFPAGTFTTDAGGLQIPSGNSSFLNASTPIGAEFGSSQGRGYLKFGTAAGGKPSTTTITFDSPTPAGDWGFALGDIDADHAKITATDANGMALTAAQLGFQRAFNYCGSAPLPSACKSKVSTDKPTWDPATSSLIGNVRDTDGASGWFKPTVPIKSLKIVFSVQSGIPVGQLWIAAKWPKGKPDIALTKQADPHTVLPGGKVVYTVKVTNKGTADEPRAQFTDDLSDVIDDAHYNNDAKADRGTVTYTKPKLSWEGPVAAGETRTITYSATIDNPPKGNKKILNAIIGDGPRMTCQGGKGPGCTVTVVLKPKPKPRKIPHDACRRAVPPPATEPFCDPVRGKADQRGEAG